MASEEKSVFQLNYVRSELRIVHYHRLQNLDLNFCLSIEFRFVSDYLESHHLLFLVVESLENLSKRTLTKATDDLISIGYGISGDNFGLA